MTTHVLSSQPVKTPQASRTLTVAATIWFVVATAGQWLFGAYILLFYGRSALSGDFERWNNVLPHGYVEGDWKGNLLVGVHVLLAAILVVGGPLQLMPAVRQRFRVFHRRLGKIYVVTAITVSTAGVIMIWTRGTVGDTLMHVSNSIQAGYIISFALLAIKYARARQFARHRVWTLRLFMVVNGVWFFRVGLMAWLVLNGGPAGFDPKTFTGPFLITLSILTYAVPISLIMLELYLYAQRKYNRTFSLVISAIILLFTVIMVIGIFGATMGMWLPKL